MGRQVVTRNQPALACKKRGYLVRDLSLIKCLRTCLRDSSQRACQRREAGNCTDRWNDAIGQEVRMPGAMDFCPRTSSCQGRLQAWPNGEALFSIGNSWSKGLRQPHATKALHCRIP